MIPGEILVQDLVVADAPKLVTVEVDTPEADAAAAVMIAVVGIMGEVVETVEEEAGIKFKL